MNSIRTTDTTDTTDTTIWKPGFRELKQPRQQARQKLAYLMIKTNSFAHFVLNDFNLLWCLKTSQKIHDVTSSNQHKTFNTFELNSLAVSSSIPAEVSVHQMGMNFFS